VVNHQLEVNGSSAILTIVLDVLGPSFAFDVDQNTG
jgi:hypothetical protein